jgi:ribonuclease Z
MRITFLGTSGSMPSKDRGASGVVVRRGSELLMFDCGEGTQRQMVKARIGFQRPMRVFITHLHGDHVLGLPGLLQSMSLLRREKKLHVYGPSRLVKFVKAFSESLGGPIFPVILYEITEPGVIHKEDGYRVEAVKAVHRTNSWSYGLFEAPRPGLFNPEKARELGLPEGPIWNKLQHGEDVELDGVVFRPEMVCGPPRAGRSIIYSGDTSPNDDLISLTKGADVLIHESTFLDELTDRAEEDGHTTAAQAAMVAKKAGVGRLILTHISSRYPEPDVVLTEAKKVFKNVIVASDLLEIDVPLKKAL